MGKYQKASLRVLISKRMSYGGDWWSCHLSFC